MLISITLYCQVLITNLFVSSTLIDGNDGTTLWPFVNNIYVDRRRPANEIIDDVNRR